MRGEMCSERRGCVMRGERCYERIGCVNAREDVSAPCVALPSDSVEGVVKLEVVNQ